VHESPEFPNGIVYRDRRSSNSFDLERRARSTRSVVFKLNNRGKIAFQERIMLVDEAIFETYFRIPSWYRPTTGSPRRELRAAST